MGGGNSWLTQSYPTNFHVFVRRKVLGSDESPEDWHEITDAEKTALEKSDAEWVRPPQSLIDEWEGLCYRGKTLEGILAKDGGWNEKTGFFELNGIKDIGTEEAIRIKNYGISAALVDNLQSNMSGLSTFRNVRTIFPIYTSGIYLWLSGVLSNSVDVEVVRFLDYYNRSVPVEVLDSKEGSLRTMIISDCLQFGYNVSACRLKKMLGIYIDRTGNFGKGRLPYIEELWLYQQKFDMPSLFASNTTLRLECWNFLIGNAANTDTITITVHNNVYAKLLGIGDYSDGNGTREEWMQLNQDASARQISFATA